VSLSPGCRDLDQLNIAGVPVLILIQSRNA
jgi:hypothetical protein